MHHPIQRFIAAGLPVVVSTDDPGMFGITLKHELDWVARHVHDSSDIQHTLRTNAHRFRSEVLSGREEA